MSTASTPQGQGPPLSARTLAWLAQRPPGVRALVHRVWSALNGLQRSGRHPHPGAVAALIADLIEHQPSRTGRCRACPRHHSWHPWWSWRHRWQRPLFPCIVWITTDLQMHGRSSPCSSRPSTR